MALFGPSRKEIWRKLSEEIGAQYIEGGLWKGDKVVAEHGDWAVTLDTYAVSTGHTTVVCTRMRAPYVNPDGFRFSVYRKTVFSGVGKLFGMQDVEIGDPSFDDSFIVKATSEPRVRELLADPRIRDLIARQKDIQLSVKGDEGWFGSKFPDGVDELYFSVVGVIKDTDRLKLLFDLFAETLDCLTRMGAADPGPANVQLK
jgi:hypothetical protein